MTDATTQFEQRKVRRVDTTSEAARARVLARYRSESRFKSYGLASLAITAAFVVILISDVLVRGLPAFWQHALITEVNVPKEAVSKDGAVTEAAIRSADYAAITRTALEEIFPGLQGRDQRRQLTRLLSTGAADELRERLVADPSLAGSKVPTRLLFSDDADLYFKGAGTNIITTRVRGIATPSATTGEVTVLTSANDFGDAIVAIKQKIAIRAAELRTEANRLGALGSEALAERVKGLNSDAEALEQKASASTSEQTLDNRMPSLLVKINGGLVKITKLSSSAATGTALLPLKSTTDAKPADWQLVTYETAESNRKVVDQEVAFLERMKDEGKVQSAFNWRFLTAGDSREPELAGIRGALVGTALTLFVTLALCVPVGVMAAVYLEEFAPKNRLTDVIEVNINNLAAVPSIVFGLLGLAVFLNFFGLPRSAPLVGGLVLALLVLPTIIIASRAALKAVPPSIKEAALGVGASHQQAVFHHVLPLAMPGIMTGTIIGMAHALGETAPLLMIGMIAFIVDVPGGFTEAATVLPVQIYLWSDLPEAAFKAKTAATIIVLLLFLFAMNGLAIWLRKKFERRW